VKLTIATGDYAHTRPLRDARVVAGGSGVFDVDWVCDRPQTIFRRTFDRDAPYDVAEMSLATAWTLPDRVERDFVALPVFPSRMYRLSGFYVGNDVIRPEDLVGGRIGVVRFGQTAAVWSRALLQHQFDIDIASIEWWVAERQPFEPKQLTLHDAGSVERLESMLVENKLDCLIATSVPAVFTEGRARRLFADWAAREQAFYSETGTVPIMHTVVIKRTLVETHPGLPVAIVQRFEAAKHTAIDWLRDTDASSLPLPLQHGGAEGILQNGRVDAWPYGLEPNRAVLDAFAEYMFEQGLTSCRIAPEAVFHQ